jgi:lipopolysaccharide export LptBFGC system permease protein LptF
MNAAKNLLRFLRRKPSETSEKSEIIARNSPENQQLQQEQETTISFGANAQRVFYNIRSHGSTPGANNTTQTFPQSQKESTYVRNKFANDRRIDISQLTQYLLLNSSSNAQKNELFAHISETVPIELLSKLTKYHNLYSTTGTAQSGIYATWKNPNK